MKLQIWINSYFFVALVLKVKSSAEGSPKANLTALQEKVEKLIETVLAAIQKYYQESDKEFKCLPDKYADQLMNAVRNGIDCVEENHKRYQEGRIDLEEHRKEFHECFAKTKSAVEYLLKNSDPADNNCPPELVEKTFQINITTSYTKTFNVNIQNGVDVWYNKTVHVTRLEEPCRNYPEVPFYDKPDGRKLEVTTYRTWGVLQPEAGYEYRRSGTRGNTDEGNLRGDRVSSPDVERSREKPNDEAGYAYFESSQNTREEGEEPEVLRKLRSSVLERQPEVTA